MAQPARKKSAKTSAPRIDADSTLLGGLLAVAVLVTGLLMAKAAGASWLSWDETAGLEGSEPKWMTTETVRATTADGAVLKAKVVLDAPDADTRSLLTRRAGQVALLMQVSVSEHDRSQSSGGERVQRLADDIRERLNDFLVASRVPPVREVVIQDLVVSTP